jgi:hypothetical protein
VDVLRGATLAVAIDALGAGTAGSLEAATRGGAPGSL